MQSLLEEVLRLQLEWSANNTPEMGRRGVVARSDVPKILRTYHDQLAAAMDVPPADLGIQGRDGTGMKTEIPWIRVFSKLRSPSATTGWYVVYLFSADGDRLYLSLNQGTTTWTGTDFAPRKPGELKARVDWARPLIATELAARPDLVKEIDLQARKTALGPGYEAGNVVAVEYRRGSVPTQTTLVDDLLFMVTLLGALYRAAELVSGAPGDPAPEIVEATEAAEKSAGRRTVYHRGQGFHLTAEERRIVELHSVRMAIDHLAAQGWVVKDFGAKESFDLLGTKDGDMLHVEVKGTTSEGAQVVLTRAEVEQQRKVAPANALIVVHSIRLDRSTTPATAAGGVLRLVSPWTIEDGDLTAVSYFYRTGL